MHFDRLHAPELMESTVHALKCSLLAYKKIARHLLLSLLPLQQRHPSLAQQKSECKPTTIPPSLFFQLNVNPPSLSQGQKEPSHYRLGLASWDGSRSWEDTHAESIAG